MKTLTLAALLAIGLVACGGETRQTSDPRLTSSGPNEERVVGWPDLGRGSARFIRIDLGPDNFAECRHLSPKFPFDSASTYAQDHEQLAALAACLNAPGMRERTITLVGRADPQGSDAYNEQLGMKRALAIKAHLIENGIVEGRIQVLSEGERAATGDTPDYSAGHDRRVDVIVRGGTHGP
jgi:peptidoglycan-associated lipoprotein